MQIDQVIEQLRTLAPLFRGNVAGAAAYANGVNDQVWLPRPAAYVIPNDEDASENLDMGALQQLITERIAVIVDLDNATDRRGQYPASQLHLVRAAVWRAILNWRPDWDPAYPERNNAARGFYYLGGELQLLDRARLHYAFAFGLETTVTDCDGWQPPGVPLTEIQVQVTKPSAPTTPTAVSFDIKLPQS